MNNISMVNDHARVVGSTSLAAVFNLIKDPKSPHREKINEIRQLYTSGAYGEADKIKGTLQGFTCSGVFNKKRTTKNLEAYSGMLMLDLDNLQPCEVRDARSKAEGTPFTHGYFISPSGYGLKIVVKVSSDAGDHKTAYEQVKVYYEQELGHKLDKTCDVARLTYISYDEGAFFNENSAVFQVDLTDVRRVPLVTTNNGQPIELTKKEKTAAFKKALAFTEKTVRFEEGSRNTFTFHFACNANRQGIKLEDTLTFCEENYAEGWDEKELQDTVIGAYNNYASEAGTWRTLRHVNINQSTGHDKGENHGNEGSELENTPTIPVDIIRGMPDIISNIAMMLTSERERDTFVTGALTVLSGCLGGIKGLYDGIMYHPNLFSFIIAPAASGKGALRLAGDLGLDLHEKMKKESEIAEAEYNRLMRDYNDSRNKDHKMEKPERPPFKALFPAGNSSSASIYDHLNESGGVGVICETEADTVANCMNNDWGNYSDLLRKVFHHERISSGRKTTGKRMIDILNPRLSVALSGTVGQVSGLIPSAENGLFSRFIYYQFAVSRKWRNVSPANGKGNLPQIIATKSREVTAMVEYLDKNTSEFKLTELQWDKLNGYFEKKLTEVSCMVSEEVSATVMRMGLITFRIAMILSAIKKYEDKSKMFTVICTDNHFEMAIRLSGVYLEHALLLFRTLPVQNKNHDLGTKQAKFLELLPMEFTRDKAIEIAGEAGLAKSDSWVDRWLKRFISYDYLVKVDYNLYRKLHAGGAAGDSETPLPTIGMANTSKEKAA